jgi:hypothetical protein
MSMAVDTAAATTTVSSPGWIRSRTFDVGFIGLISAAAVATGLVALIEPSLVVWLLVVDVWLLGYHHVVSTFTRLAMDKQSFQQHRFLVVQLPVIVVVCTLAAIGVFGFWILPTVYLYWQWFHYTRQSYGIERAYRRKADPNAQVDDYVTTRSLYLLPMFGILYRSWQAQPQFLGMEVWYVPTPELVLWIVGGLATVAGTWWLVQSAIAAYRGRLAPAHFLYMVSHQAVFVTGYILIPDITAGWLVLNVWHNLQYIMFVWAFNNKRFQDRIDPQAKFLSTLCQKEHVLSYLAFCVGISSVVYLMLHQTSATLFSTTTVSAALTTSMIINFHHYVVDGIIWKRRNMQPAATPAAT